MDDQRPISGAEKAFFSLGTGRGIFVVSVSGNFWHFQSPKYLLCLSLLSLKHLKTSVMVSYEIKERVIKKQKMKCLDWQKRFFRMSICLGFKIQNFHQKHMFAWQVILYSSFNLEILTNTRNGQARKSMLWIIWRNYEYSWQQCSCQLVCFNTNEQSRFKY